MQAIDLTLFALLLMLCGWGFFRKSGVSLKETGAQWNPRKQLTPPGVALLITGFGLALAAIAVKLLV